jgi:excisionase family DNA binding protein
MHAEPLPGLTPENPAPCLDAGRPPKLLLRPRDAARALAVSERTLWTLTRRGSLRCVRIGRAVRYDVRDLDAFIATAKGAPQ